MCQLLWARNVESFSEEGKLDYTRRKTLEAQEETTTGTQLTRNTTPELVSVVRGTTP